ncbi:probable inactive peptidyl-prolyl cis-trans isomerase-like 6 isoform X4 [Salminus brasiliensis]|uniref:probable inactive peptidyl-prolyl cis-trans isomerase-like 6 isoform X4 n=1 Tax=Salminus brasiliensis TaxID=930266 RepID=UPI003B83831F
MAPEVRLEIVGLMKMHHFQVAKSIAEGLKQKFPASFVDPIIRPLLELDWNMYLSDKKQALKGEVWQYRGSLMCFVNGQLIGDEKELSRWAERQWQFTFYRPQALYAAMTEEYCRQQLLSTGHVFVYMDVEIGGEAAGRLLFEICVQRRVKTLKLCVLERQACPRTSSCSATRTPCSTEWCLMAGCREETRVLLYLTTSEVSWEWPTKVPIVTVPSFTSHYSQPYGWIEIMWHLGKLLKAQTSFGDWKKCPLITKGPNRTAG